MKELIPLVEGLFFLGIGIMCLFWAKKIQEKVLQWSAQGRIKFNPFPGWVKTRWYVLSLRIIGVMAIGVFALIVYVVFQETGR